MADNSPARAIIHVDMDEFFAAVEKLDDPALRGKPILVGGDPKGRGVVATASYEARVFGCHSAMPMAKALRLCPQAIIIHPRFERYSALSGQVFDILHEFTPLVEPLSIDEAFLDVTGSRRLLGPAPEIAAQIKDRIRREVGLTASVGVAPNKFLAKLASDMKKPDALVVIDPQRIHEVLDPLPVTKIWGVGPAAAKRFERLNISTIGQLHRAAPELVREAFGEPLAQHFLELSAGLDSRPVETENLVKSVSQEETFAKDVGRIEKLRGVLLGQVQEVGRRLREQNVLARTVTLKIRYGDFTTLTRSQTLPMATHSTEVLWEAARGILDTWAAGQFHPLRLLGMCASGLEGPQGRQLSLFEDASLLKQQRLDAALDQIDHRFVSNKVRRGQGEH